MNAKLKTSALKPEVIKEGSVSVTIYTTRNRIYRTNPASGQKELKSEHPQFTLVHYLGNRRIKQKFADIETARAKAILVVTKLANGETEVLKLTGADSSTYVQAKQKLRDWRTAADLYLAAARRLLDGVTLKECVDFWLKRHQTNLPQKTVA